MSFTNGFKEFYNGNFSKIQVNLTERHFINKLLYKSCHANLEVLADYIIALRETGIEEPQDFANNLQDFLQDSTEAFVSDLIDYIGNNIINDIDNELMPKVVDNVAVSESEIEVDYEDNSSAETVLDKAPLLRQLREYSPERWGSEQSPSASSANKKPCSNFSKKGFCRFGDECRFAHINLQARRRTVSSRVKLMNLPNYELLNPAVLTQIMSKYGSVINLTIYPEKSEAMIQFASGEEASRAVKEGINDFEGNVVIESETIRQPGSVSDGFKAAINRTLKPQFPQHQHSHPVPFSNEKLKSLIALQKQQQTLLETNLFTQKTLLNHLQSPTISAVERTELLGSLSQIQENVMGVQEMLKRTTELVVEAASKSSKPSSHAYSQHHNNNNNSYHHHQQANTRPFRPQSNYTARPFGNNTYIPGKPGSSGSSYNNVYLPGRPQVINRPPGSNTLDLRPTTLKLSSLKSTSLINIHDLQRHFTPYGQIQSLIMTDNGESALIKYQKHGDAQKALEKGSKEGMEIEFVKQA